MQTNPDLIPQLDDDFSDLEALLTEAKSEQSSGIHAKAAQERLRKNSGSVAERVADALLVSRWEAEREWLPKAQVAVFTHTTCLTCQATCTIFTTMMHRQEHRSLRTLKRWIKALETIDSLPKEFVVKPEFQPMCGKCMVEQGWTTAGPYPEGWQ